LGDWQTARIKLRGSSPEFATCRGDLVTLDHWYNRGYGAVLALYRADGKLLKNYKLADLFPQKQIDSFPDSVSSIMWTPATLILMMPRKSSTWDTARRPTIGDLMVELANGSVRLYASLPKSLLASLKCSSLI
jgi:hypothetical protein